MKNVLIVILLLSSPIAVCAPASEIYEVEVTGLESHSVTRCARDTPCLVNLITTRTYIKRAETGSDAAKLTPGTFEYGISIVVDPVTDDGKQVLQITYSDLKALERVDTEFGFIETPKIELTSSQQGMVFGHPYSVGPYTIIVRKVDI